MITPGPIDDNDIYSDSATELTVWRLGKRIARFRAVVHWASNVGLFVRLPKAGGLVAVMPDEDGNYSIQLPPEQ
jgi:hypothetical protein